MAITEERVYEVLGEIYDPEIPIDIVNLGLVYSVEVVSDVLNINMSMTSPGCPAATQIVTEAKLMLEDLPK